MSPVRVVRVIHIWLIAAVAALAVSGCVHQSGPGPGAYVDANGVPYAPRGLPLASAAPRPVVVDDLDTRAYAGRGIVTGSIGSTGTVGFAPNVGDPEYRLDAGDKLRIVVYGQEGLTNSYTVSVNGTITVPLIGTVTARGLTPGQLANVVAGKLRNGYIREPYVAAEVETYRPFFILGEVAAPGQYPYVPNLTVETAVAIAGGFTPRAKRDEVQMTRSNAAGSTRAAVPLQTPMSPGDSIVVGERWF